MSNASGNACGLHRSWLAGDELIALVAAGFGEWISERSNAEPNAVDVDNRYGDVRSVTDFVDYEWLAALSLLDLPHEVFRRSGEPDDYADFDDGLEDEDDEIVVPSWLAGVLYELEDEDDEIVVPSWLAGVLYELEDSDVHTMPLHERNQGWRRQTLAALIRDLPPALLDSVERIAPNEDQSDAVADTVGEWLWRNMQFWAMRGDKHWRL